MKIIFATGNPGKVKEIRKIMGGDFEVLTMKEAGFDPEIDENGETFEANALIKVRAIGPVKDAIVMSDDSGLAIDAMGGEPGVHSARFMGEDAPYPVKWQAIFERLSHVEGKERSARFVAVIAAVFPDGTEKTAEGIMEGYIAKAPKGENGFGYDPIFINETGITNGELDEGEKNAISHRGKALRKMKTIIEDYMRLHTKR